MMRPSGERGWDKDGAMSNKTTEAMMRAAGLRLKGRTCWGKFIPTVGVVEIQRIPATREWVVTASRPDGADRDSFRSPREAISRTQALEQTASPARQGRAVDGGAVAC